MNFIKKRNLLYALSSLSLVFSISYADASENNDTKVKAEDFLSYVKKKDIKIQEQLKNLDGKISFCSGQMDASNRLSCFENIARDEGVYVEPVSFKEKKENSSEYQWSKKNVSDISKQRIVITGVETSSATDSLNPTDKNPPHAYFNVRCKKGDYDLYISYDKEFIEKIKNDTGKEMYPTKPFSVKIKVAGEEKEYPFVSGNSGHSIGLWGSNSSESLIKYLNNYAANNNDDKQKITTTINLGGEHYITTTFSMINMYNNLNSLLMTCHATQQ